MGGSFSFSATLLATYWGCAVHDVKTEIRAALAEQMAVLEKNISDTAKLKEDLGFDSLDFVELAM